MKLSGEDWVQIWNQFNKWYAKKEIDDNCEACGHNEYVEPDWDDQADKIQQLVDRQLKKNDHP